MIHVAKTKALISCAVTVQLICVFVFPDAKSRFSHDSAHFRSMWKNSITKTLASFTSNFVSDCSSRDRPIINLCIC